MHQTRRVITITVALALLFPLAASAAPILDAGHVREHTLANGMHIVVKEEHGWGVVAVGLYVRAGLLYDPVDKPGVAHFIEHMLFRTGEEAGEPSPIVATVEGSGGQISAATNRDFTLVQVVTSPGSLSKTWPILADTLMDAKFSPEDVIRERRIISQEIAEREGMAAEMIGQAVWEQAYPNHPYGNSVGGTTESLDTIDQNVLTAYHSNFYVPNNMSVIIVGDVDADKVFADVQASFGGYEQSPVEWEPPTADVEITSARTDIQTKPLGMTIIGMGFRGPGIQRKREVCAMDIIYTILGEGRRARLATEVQDKELITAFDLQYITHRDDGLVLMTAVTEPGKETVARQAILDEFATIAADGVTEEELALAKRQLRNSYAFSNEAYSDQIGSLGFYEMIDTYRFAIDYIDEVDEVTVDDIKATAAKYFNPDTRVQVIFRPPAPRRPGGQV